ncbi:MAG: hypothetical protein L3J29_09540 [Cyclobacteriaceae bacterium]|nr:hypothetical protein [Cyclobacteriaceae bacterium]
MMQQKNTYWIIAGALNLLTFFLHLIGGQIDLVNPMLDTSLGIEIKSQLVGAWNMISIILLATSLVLLYAGFKQKFTAKLELISFVGYLNLSFCFPFILTGFYYGLLVPQWIFFLPIGVLTIIGIKKAKLTT